MKGVHAKRKGILAISELFTCYTLSHPSTTFPSPSPSPSLPSPICRYSEGVVGVRAITREQETEIPKAASFG